MQNIQICLRLDGIRNHKSATQIGWSMAALLASLVLALGVSCQRR